MKIGYHAPPPQSRTGVADYAETLRNALGIDTRGDDSAEVHLYHLGNNPLHADIYRQALQRPGLVVLHDAVLHHFLLGSLSREEYVDEFVYNYGEWRRYLAGELWEERGGSAIDPRYFHYPLLRRVAETARAIVVHNPAAARMAKEHGALNVHVIPHFATPRVPPDEAAVLRFRECFGIPGNAALFGVFGFLRETKRVLPILRAFRRLHTVRPDAALLLAGDPVSPDLQRLLATETVHPAIHRTGFLSERNFHLATAAIDCCVNLRYPGAGETSGVAIRMAAAGTPLIVTDSEEYANFPEAACLRVRPGVAEAEELFEYMGLVSAFPQVARATGKEARDHVLQHHSLENVARQYRELLCALAS